MNLEAQCIDVCCEAFYCRHIKFKIVFQSASEHPIFIKKIEEFFGPLPKSHPQQERVLTVLYDGEFTQQPVTCALCG